MQNQVIDVATKGNVIRFYIGENGKQWGDDWDDAPYEHNAGVVYDKFVDRTFDVAIPFDMFVSEPGRDHTNSEWCKQDMIDRKIHCVLIESSEWGGTELLKIYFGDPIPDVAAALENIFKKAVADTLKAEKAKKRKAKK